MTRSISDINVMQEYLRGVLDRADHHAPNVDNIALAVAGAVIWRKDADDLEVHERDGEMKNVLWVTIGRVRYALSYNHDAQAIDVRRDSTRGAVLASFTNADSVQDVRAFFEAL